MFVIISIKRLRNPFLLLLGGLFFSVGLFASTEVLVDGESSERKLCELAITGELSDELVSQFYQYALKNAKEKISAPDEFWDWLAEHQQIQQGLLVGLHPNYNPDVIKHLQELKDNFGTQVEQYSHLALAFAFVYGAAKGETIRAPWMDWVEKNRPVPSCEESFAYYIDNENKMLFSLEQFPWPLLLYIADNDVPLKERQWVLSHYGSRSLASLSKIHSDPHYGGEAARKVAKYDGTPMALPRILSDGGVCSQQAYYASSVFKSLGVPSVRLLGRNHAYEGWVVENEGLKAQIGVAVGRKNGYYLCPLTRTILNEYNFKLLVLAINHSYDKYLESKIAAHVFKILPNDRKKQAMGLLEDAIKRNPYVLDSWIEYAQSCADRIDMLESGWLLYDRARAILPDYPELACVILNKLTMAEGAKEQYSKIRIQFRTTINLLVIKDRRDLALDVYKTHADYLLRTKGVQATIDTSLSWFRLDDILVDTQKKLFDHMYKIAIESKDNKILEKLLTNEYHRRLILSRKCGENMFVVYSRSYAQVAKAYIAYLTKSGDMAKASQIRLERDSVYDKNMKLNNLQDVVIQGIALGATEKQVTNVAVLGQGCHVWRILYDLPQGLIIRLRAEHAVVGQKGAFYFTAWADKDGDGIPDTHIGISPVMVAEKEGRWSDWEFVSNEKTIFVGVATKKKISFHYQMGGELEGYDGLSDRVFYTRAFNGTPEQSVHPRYTNMKVEILRK